MDEYIENKIIEAIKDVTGNDVPAKNLFIVWQCYILGNRKYLVGCHFTDLYIEVTFNKRRNETYIDIYNKVKNICITPKVIN